MIERSNNSTNFFFLSFFVFFCIFFASSTPQRPTSSYHANLADSPTRIDMSLQVGEIPDSNPGLQVLQPGALPLSHHIPHGATTSPFWASNVAHQMSRIRFFLLQTLSLSYTQGQSFKNKHFGAIAFQWHMFEFYVSNVLQLIMLLIFGAK